MAEPALYPFIGSRLPSTASCESDIAVRPSACPPTECGGGSTGGGRWRADREAVGYVQATLNAPGSGYAGEATLAMVTRLREGEVQRLVAHVHPEHGASQAVARAIGPLPTDIVVDGETRWQWASTAATTI